MMPTRPVVVRAAPAIPRVPAFRLPSASPASCDWPAVESFHLHSVMQRLVAHCRKSHARIPDAWADRNCFHCDTRSHVVSELVEEVWLMPEI